MKYSPLRGIDGSEPIGFLAGLGTLRLLDRITNEAKLAWKELGGGWYPYFIVEDMECSAEHLAGLVSNALQVLAGSGEFGVAHMGEKIGIDKAIFRKHATRAILHFSVVNKEEQLTQSDAAMTAATLAACASDAIIEKSGAVSYTALSFSNGASGQLLLKDFLTAARLCTPERLTSTFTGTPVSEYITSLNWDPKDQRAAAHRWRDPAAEKQPVDPGINALAFMGMAYFTAVPGKRLFTLGWRNQKPRGLAWPLWEQPLSTDVVATCIGHVFSTINPEKIGIKQVRFSRVTNPDGKRNYFAPSCIYP